MSEQLLTVQKINAIEAVLAKGYRVELIPVKDGVKVIQVQRKEIKWTFFPAVSVPPDDPSVGDCFQSGNGCSRFLFL